MKYPDLSKSYPSSKIPESSSELTNYPCVNSSSTESQNFITPAQKVVGNFMKGYSNLIYLKEFFEDINDYVILKLPEIFPNYFDHSDIDILCRNINDLLRHILEVGKKYEKRGFRIEVTYTGTHVHVDFFAPGAQKLNLRFDLIDSLCYEKFQVAPQYTQVVLESGHSVQRGGASIRVPALEHDLATRFFEYVEYHDKQASKVKHWDYVKNHCHPGFLDVVNTFTDLAVSVRQVDGRTHLDVTRKGPAQGSPPRPERRAESYLRPNDDKAGRMSHHIKAAQVALVDGMEFRQLQLTKCGTNSIGYGDKYVIKIEHRPNPKKLHNLAGEAEVIEYLNGQGCVSCPRLHSKGILPNGQHYLILERWFPQGAPNLADMMLSLLEQKSLGVYQGDFKPENMIFDGSVCHLIDYDQAQRDDRFRHMGNIEFIEWMAADFTQRRGHDFFTDPARNFDRDRIYRLFPNDSFDLQHTTLMKRQVTTDTESGIYHTLHHPRIFVEGARGLEARAAALNQIDFEPGEKVLDVGCNLGLLSHYLHDRGCDVTGVDIDPYIILTARMVANILNKRIAFEQSDIGFNPPAGCFDTICLFSVLHHVADVRGAARFISQRCGRVILESRLVEQGSQPTDCKWMRTTSWRFASRNEMIATMENLFPGFRFEQDYGQGDRDRFLLSFHNPDKAWKLPPPQVGQWTLSCSAPGKHRMDYFIIWGHGLPFTRQIIGMIRDVKGLEIVTITKKQIENIEKFVQDVYACDTVPFKHLVSKTRYLVTTPPEIIFILVRNNDPQEQYFGEGAFRHIQCKLVKEVKEQIRNRFNPHKDGRRSEDHVVHASDYESQVEHVLKVLNLPPIEFFTRQPNADLDVPFHIEPFDNYEIHQVDIDSLYANILGVGLVKIADTPHYKYLTADKATYLTYCEKYFGKQLIEDHCPEAYDLMTANFKYDFLTHNGKRSLILARALKNGGYQILDGVHRAAILKHRGVKTIRIAEPIQKVEQEHGASCELVGLIFSKDRAMQLQATIESFLLHCQDVGTIDLVVLYKTSNELHAQQYDELKKRFSGINFIEESNFRTQVLTILGKCNYVLFLVDDNLFVKDFHIIDIISSLQENTDAVGFSLRLGKNTNYCYTRDSKQALPAFQQTRTGILKYNWTQAECDFGYPLELSSSIYRTRDILILLDKLEFNNPNMLEGQMAANAQLFAGQKSTLLCCENSLTFCDPINKVQSVWNNRCCSDNRYSADALAGLFYDGVRIDVERYLNFVPNACHQEVQLYFKQTADLPSKKLISTAKSITQYDNQPNANTKPQFSIVMANCNRARYISQAIKSVINQTFKDWELIIVDDCSTDNSLEIITQYLNDKRIKLIQPKNHYGYAASMKTGITNVHSDHFGILRSDDCLLPNAIETMYEHHTKFPDCGLIYSQFAYCDENLNQKCIGFCREILQGRSSLDGQVSHFMTFKLRDYLKTTGYDESILYAEDIDIIYKMEEVTCLRFVDKCVYLYRELPNSISHSKSKINVSIMSGVKARINALERRCTTLATSKRQTFEQMFRQVVKAARANYREVEQYFIILEKLYENGLFNDLELPPDIKSRDIEDKLLWIAANVTIKFDKLFELLADRRKKEEQPLVSVYTVTYNAQKFIAQAIDSVLAQTYKNFELLIVNDGSTDETSEIIASYSDERIRHIYKKHKNFASGMNRAITEAKGKYIIGVDSDDFIDPDYIEKLIICAEKHPEVDYFYPAQFVLVDEAGHHTGVEWNYLDFSDNRILPAFLFEKGFSPIPNPGSLKRKSLFDKVGRYEEVDTVEDFAFLCKNALRVNFRRVEEHSTYFYRRLQSGNSYKLMARNRIMAKALNDMVSIYPPELLCPKIANISDKILRKQKYFEYLTTTFYRHANGPMVQFGDYFRQYADYYKQKVSEMFVSKM